MEEEDSGYDRHFSTRRGRGRGRGRSRRRGGRVDGVQTNGKLFNYYFWCLCFV